MWHLDLLSSVINIREFIDPSRSGWLIASSACIVCKRLKPRAGCTHRRISEQLNHLLGVDTSWFTQELENTSEFLNDCLELRGLVAWELELKKRYHVVDRIILSYIGPKAVRSDIRQGGYTKTWGLIFPTVYISSNKLFSPIFLLPFIMPYFEYFCPLECLVLLVQSKSCPTLRPHGHARLPCLSLAGVLMSLKRNEEISLKASRRNWIKIGWILSFPWLWNALWGLERNGDISQPGRCKEVLAKDSVSCGLECGKFLKAAWPTEI